MLTDFNPLPSCEGRPSITVHQADRHSSEFQSTPLMRGETWWSGLTMTAHVIISIHSPHARGDCDRRSSGISNMLISIHSPHARGDSINLQKSVWIQGSLYNKNITAHFSKTLKPFLWPKIKLLWVRSLPKSHDSFTFARLFRGCISSLHDLASHALRQMIRINVKLIVFKAARRSNPRFTMNIHEFEQLPRRGFAQFTVMLEDNQFADGHHTARGRSVVFKHIQNCFPKERQIVLVKSGRFACQIGGYKALRAVKAIRHNILASKLRVLC